MCVCVCVCVCVFVFMGLIYGSNKPTYKLFVLDRNTRNHTFVQRHQKWYFIPLCLTTKFISYGIRVKWNDPENRVVPTLTSPYSSY